MSDLKVGFVGIGTMGWPMAKNIVAGGYALTVFDLSTDQIQAFANETGAKAARSITDLADCDMVVTMLPNGHIVKEVLTQMDDGAYLKNVKPGAIVIDMSSSEPVGTQTLGAILNEKQVTLLDAPVSGAKPRAIDGTLTIMIGGDNEAAIEKAKPLLSTMGNRLFEGGKLGCGHALKALNNYIAATSYTATAEACLIARRFGLDLNTLIDVLNVSTGKSFISEIVMKEHVVNEKYATGFAMGLLTKDVRIAAGLGKAVGLDAPLSRLIEERWEAANEALGETADHSEAIKSWDNEL